MRKRRKAAKKRTEMSSVDSDGSDVEPLVQLRKATTKNKATHDVDDPRSSKRSRQTDKKDVVIEDNEKSDDDDLNNDPDVSAVGSRFSQRPRRSEKKLVDSEESSDDSSSDDSLSGDSDDKPSEVSKKPKVPKKPKAAKVSHDSDDKPSEVSKKRKAPKKPKAVKVSQPAKLSKSPQASKPAGTLTTEGWYLKSTYWIKGRNSKTKAKEWWMGTLLASKNGNCRILWWAPVDSNNPRGKWIEQVYMEKGKRKPYTSINIGVDTIKQAVQFEDDNVVGEAYDRLPVIDDSSSSDDDAVSGLESGDEETELKVVAVVWKNFFYTEMMSLLTGSELKKKWVAVTDEATRLDCCFVSVTTKNEKTARQLLRTSTLFSSLEKAASSSSSSTLLSTPATSSSSNRSKSSAKSSRQKEATVLRPMLCDNLYKQREADERTAEQLKQKETTSSSAVTGSSTPTKEDNVTPPSPSLKLPSTLATSRVTTDMKELGEDQKDAVTVSPFLSPSRSISSRTPVPRRSPRSSTCGRAVQSPRRSPRFSPSSRPTSPHSSPRLSEGNCSSPANSPVLSQYFSSPYRPPSSLKRLGFDPPNHPTSPPTSPCCSAK